MYIDYACAETNMSNNIKSSQFSCRTRFPSGDASSFCFEMGPYDLHPRATSPADSMALMFSECWARSACKWGQSSSCPGNAWLFSR